MTYRTTGSLEWTSQRILGDSDRAFRRTAVTRRQDDEWRLPPAVIAHSRGQAAGRLRGTWLRRRLAIDFQPCALRRPPVFPDESAADL